MLSLLEDDASVVSAMRAGARGHVLKGAGQEELLAAVRAVAAAGALFGASVVARLLHGLDGPPPSPAFPLGVSGKTVSRADQAAGARPRRGGAARPQ